MDLATLTNTPRDFELRGVTYKVSELTMAEWGIVQQWIKDNSPTPLALLKSEDFDQLSPDDKRMLLNQAIMLQRKWPPAIGSTAWQECLQVVGKDGNRGIATLFKVILGKHQPFTLKQSSELIEDLTVKEATGIFQCAFGANEEPPKSEAGTNPPNVIELPS